MSLATASRDREELTSGHPHDGHPHDKSRFSRLRRGTRTTRVCPARQGAPPGLHHQGTRTTEPDFHGFAGAPPRQGAPPGLPTRTVGTRATRPNFSGFAGAPARRLPCRCELTPGTTKMLCRRLNYIPSLRISNFESDFWLKTNDFEWFGWVFVHNFCCGLNKRLSMIFGSKPRILSGLDGCLSITFG